MPDRLTVALIDLKQYKQNLATIRKKLPAGTQIMAVVKANAYGHGIVKIAQAAAAAGAAYAGVVSLGELKAIRQSGNKMPVLILNYLDAASVSEAVKQDASITIMDRPVIDAAQAAAEQQSKQVKIHLKLDTGMHRAGCDPADLLGLARAVVDAPNLELEGIFTHFAESEATDPAFTRQQLAMLRQAVTEIKAAGIEPPLIHAANSAAAIALPETHLNMVRVGLAGYGYNPFDPGHDQYEVAQQDFKPILSLATQLVFVRNIAPGESVGYNRRWVAERPSTVGLLPVGYGDGWRRSPQNAGQVLVGGQVVPIIGSVAMDQTIIDLTDTEGVKVGDAVVLIGQQGEHALTVDDVAAAYGTINYEVVTALSDRISRVYKD
jgi:alanine racemase